MYIEAKELWQELDRQNGRVVNGMNQLNKLSEIDSTFQDKVKAWTVILKHLLSVPSITCQSDHTSHSNSLVTNALDEISAAFTVSYETIFRIHFTVNRKSEDYFDISLTNVVLQLSHQSRLDYWTRV